MKARTFASDHTKENACLISCLVLTSKKGGEMEYLLILNAFLFLVLGVLAIMGADDAIEIVPGFICVIIGIMNAIAAFNAMGYIIKVVQ